MSQRALVFNVRYPNSVVGPVGSSAPAVCSSFTTTRGRRVRAGNRWRRWRGTATFDVVEFHPPLPLASPEVAAPPSRPRPARRTGRGHRRSDTAARAGRPARAPPPGRPGRAVPAGSGRRPATVPATRRGRRRPPPAAPQYYPKGTDLSVHSEADLDWVAAELNDRPRKRLAFKKPIEQIGPLLLR